MPTPKIGSQPLTVMQDKIVRMKANGYTNREIIREVWNLEEADDPKAFHAKELYIRRWMHHPQVAEVWKDEIRRQVLPMLSKGLKVIRNQADMTTNDWLANKAANDLITFAGKQAFGDEQNRITVQIQGMPDLGTPDDAEPEE